MNRNLSPKSVRLAVSGAVAETLYDAVSRAVEWPAFLAVNMAVALAVDRAVNRAVLDAFRVSPPHPNIHRFLAEIQQSREGAP